jgi:hypothetical protein
MPRRRSWLPAGLILLALACVAGAIVYRIQNRDMGVVASPAQAQPSAEQPPAASSHDLLSDAQRQKLIGSWRRADAAYLLEIRSVAADGQIDAAYLNPRPIHVSKAQAALKSGKTTVMIELRDRLYPGSYYTLTYNASDDRLAGVYHHLGIHQDIDVAFNRLGQPVGDANGARDGPP